MLLFSPHFGIYLMRPESECHMLLMAVSQGFAEVKETLSHVREAKAMECFLAHLGNGIFDTNLS